MNTAGKNTLKPEKLPSLKVICLKLRYSSSKSPNFTDFCTGGGGGGGGGGEIVPPPYKRLLNFASLWANVFARLGCMTFKQGTFPNFRAKKLAGLSYFHLG